ncbi:lactate dehydrogenase [Malacoplasma penetrans]|uniref:D-lactate dehydrogenase: D-LDH n=1 Tax=Malacoplasma penetrans (strain HF-2) TaxID=272633 RepID=Q8EWE0_MALP2|nr:NAD(P)-dependent oxidoreductase [Malacoplasma penetrans]RXY96701.1 lactate dehydrogenase [Malacoplasma penetrans]BAC44056.1 D-lactate dehydrogenase: D-LDH [Malacoplasma penetrans HF-2]
MKVICFGVREVEKPIFEKYNKYNYQLTLTSSSLSSSNLNLVDGHDAIIVRASDKVDKAVLDYVKQKNIKYVLTRTVGFDHMDIAYGNSIGIKMARVPSYSPTAIAEVAVTMAVMLSRKIAHFSFNAYNKNFVIDSFGFAKELKNSTVGIIGTGKIGLATARMFKGLGSKVIGYDVYQSEEAKQVLNYESLDNLLKESDIISFHIPYIKGENDNFINKDFINKMKDNSILINCARGQIQDEKAILDAILSNKLLGAGLDVLNNEKNYFNKKLDKFEDETINKLISLYPRVLIAPHIGSYTDEAVANMVEFSFDNLNEYVTTNSCKNKI